MKANYVNVTVRVKKIEKSEIQRALKNNAIEFIALIETGKRFGKSVYRYNGDDIESIGLYHDDLIIEK